MRTIATHIARRCVVAGTLLTTGLLALATATNAQTGPRDLSAERFVLAPDASNPFTITLEAPVLTGDVLLQLPNGVGTAFFILSESTGGQTINDGLTVNDGFTANGGVSLNGGITGTGNFTLSGGSFFGNGSGLTNLDASDLSTGTVPDGRLSGGTYTGLVSFSNIAVTGGAINNTPIGGTTRSTGRFTTLDANDNVDLGNGNDNIAINGGSGTFSVASSGVDIATSGSITNAQDIELDNSIGATTTPTAGTLYRDNIIVAWGRVTAAGGIGERFGNWTVTGPVASVYTITLPNAPTAASVVATIEGATFGQITTSRAGAVITVSTANSAGTAANRDFYFQVVARP